MLYSICLKCVLGAQIIPGHGMKTVIRFSFSIIVDKKITNSEINYFNTKIKIHSSLHSESKTLAYHELYLGN